MAEGGDKIVREKGGLRRAIEQIEEERKQQERKDKAGGELVGQVVEQKKPLGRGQALKKVFEERRELCRGEAVKQVLHGGRTPGKLRLKERPVGRVIPVPNVTIKPTVQPSYDAYSPVTLCHFHPHYRNQYG